MVVIPVFLLLQHFPIKTNLFAAHARATGHWVLSQNAGESGPACVCLRGDERQLIEPHRLCFMFPFLAYQTRPLPALQRGSAITEARCRTRVRAGGTALPQSGT
jgi:hypothetical protein